MLRNHAGVLGVFCALSLIGCRQGGAPTPNQPETPAVAKKVEVQAPAHAKADANAAPAATKQSETGSSLNTVASPLEPAASDPSPKQEKTRVESLGALKVLKATSGASADGVGGLGLRGIGSGGGGSAIGDLGGRGKGGGVGLGLGGGVGLASRGGGGQAMGSISLGGIGTSGRGGGVSYNSVGRGSTGVGYGHGVGVLSGKAVVLGANSRSSGYDAVGSEDYGDTRINNWTLVEQDALSTFAADVDTASYTLGRRKLLDGVLPPKDSVRVEEWLNYFRYRYPQPPAGAPLAVTMDAAPSPFTPGKHLLRVGVQGRSVDVSQRKPAHLTFLVDVSGSMSGPDRLPLAKRALRMLVDQLHERDTVALVTYAGNVSLKLEPTGMGEKARIHAAIEALTSGGSTAMASGIELAYQQAMKTLDGASVSRVIILSDGDANVGATSQEAILRLIAGKVKEGVTVTTVGFGMGNYKSVLMEQFANKGNGNHFYVDSLMAARRIFVEQLGGTLEVIAQDVKLQVAFDPAQVSAYRLVGYENRDIADKDFRNDKVDAGEIGSGHTVTALYEVDLKAGAGAGLVTVRVRAKQPRGVTASEKAFPFDGARLAPSFEAASSDLRFATAVMGASEVFRQSPHAAEWDYGRILRIAKDASSPESAERQEFIQLLERARGIVSRVAAR